MLCILKRVKIAEFKGIEIEMHLPTWNCYCTQHPTNADTGV